MAELSLIELIGQLKHGGSLYLNPLPSGNLALIARDYTIDHLTDRNVPMLSEVQGASHDAQGEGGGKVCDKTAIVDINGLNKALGGSQESLAEALKDMPVRTEPLSAALVTGRRKAA
jgi:hypothetical protein